MCFTGAFYVKLVFFQDFRINLFFSFNFIIIISLIIITILTVVHTILAVVNKLNLRIYIT